jgi:hypothetical protein
MLGGMLARQARCDNVPLVRRTRLGGLAAFLGASAAFLIALGTVAGPADAARTFRPRIGGALGVVPPLGRQEIAVGSSFPVAYHGGSVMRQVTIHTIFWAPNGFRFDGPPSAGALGYEALIERFLVDVAHDSGTAANVFSLLGQYPDLQGAAGYGISYNPATDSFHDADPYPRSGHQCASPSGVATCITDLQVQREIDAAIRYHPPADRGLNNLWFVFLPPNVDTCVAPGACGTNAYAGYHALSNLGHGATVYSVIPDPLIELTPPPGSDPQGNPEAESAVDTVAHETIEALTDPKGTGWMDPNGFEVGDKCETGPQQATPLGFAPNGSPYNQVINGRQYLIQAMWANSSSGCEQSSRSSRSPLPLASVSLRQFSPSVSGNIGVAKAGVAVSIRLVRAGSTVARAQALTRTNGSWGPAALRARSSRSLHGVGDDRDEIDISYGRHGPRPDVIQTGNGGNPFAQAGWTGWYDLDNGYSITSTGRGEQLHVSPCSQTGVLAISVDGRQTPSPVDFCETESDVAVLSSGPIGSGRQLSMSSQDNRAVSTANPDGALVKLTIPIGEPDSVSALGNDQALLQPTGFPVCTADLSAQNVRCTGLVPGSRYTLTSSRGRMSRRGLADGNGTLLVDGFGGLRGGDVLTLVNAARRVLTALHVAHLRVDITGSQTLIASGSCEPGAYYGPPLSHIPLSPTVGVPGLTGTGTVCAMSGSARGLSVQHIAQTDDLSGGQTRTEVPLIGPTSPINAETLYGPFVAIASAGVPGAGGSVVTVRPRIALTITRSADGRAVFRAANVDTPAGVRVNGLPTGPYRARWVLTDAAGDTRTVQTTFVQEG